MDLKKRSLKTQKSKKVFQLPKCFQLSGITKSLFSCKETRNPNQDNYVIIDLKNKSDSTENHPITSTMIQDTSNNQSIHRFQFPIPNKHNDYYVLYPDAESQPNFINYDIEETRRTTPSVSSMTTFTDYDDVTIVANDKSPISHKQCNNEEDSFNEYLHSTRINQDNLNILSSSLLPNTLSPLSHDKHSTMLHSPIKSDLQDSTLLSVSTNFLEVTSQLDTLILGLSSIYDKDTESKICTENYEATFVDDVSVHFADTLTILKDNNDDWLYVEIHSDKRRGYIPKNIVCGIQQFISQLNNYKNQINLFNLENI